jgi:ABC-type transport system involved in cytochrome bd biosynthesis fused ATPase/permease subunit
VFAMEEATCARDTSVAQNEVSIQIDDADFSWGFKVQENQEEAKGGRKLTQDDLKAVIGGVNLKLSSDDLLVVVGKVGCGKSTLLHSIMEETKLVKGSLKVKGTIAYVEQEPFILPSSVKDNILLGRKLDEVLLDKALKASQLVKDIEQLACGVETVIGERGINISGG